MFLHGSSKLMFLSQCFFCPNHRESSSRLLRPVDFSADWDSSVWEPFAAVFSELRLCSQTGDRWRQLWLLLQSEMTLVYFPQDKAPVREKSTMLSPNSQTSPKTILLSDLCSITIYYSWMLDVYPLPLLLFDMISNQLLEFKKISQNLKTSFVLKSIQKTVLQKSSYFRSGFYSNSALPRIACGAKTAAKNGDSG